MENITNSGNTIYIIRIPMSWVIGKFERFDGLILRELVEDFLNGCHFDLTKIRVLCYDDSNNRKFFRNKKGVIVERINVVPCDLFVKKTKPTPISELLEQNCDSSKPASISELLEQNCDSFVECIPSNGLGNDQNGIELCNDEGNDDLTLKYLKIAMLSFEDYLKSIDVSYRELYRRHTVKVLTRRVVAGINMKKD